MVAHSERLSARQQRILEFLRTFTAGHGYPPTIRDIANALSISSTSVVDYNLNVLEHKGYIRRTRDISRGIELLPAGEEVIGPARAASRNIVSVPIVGRIAAGEPIEALAGDLDRIDLSAEIAPTGAYALQVKGKSMVEDLIDDGDLVVVRPQDTAENGDIVVALLVDSPTAQGQATLKRLYREKDSIRLQPANSMMEPIFVKPEDVRVQGRVVAVIRQVG